MVVCSTPKRKLSYGRRRPLAACRAALIATLLPDDTPIDESDNPFKYYKAPEEEKVNWGARPWDGKSDCSNGGSNCCEGDCGDVC